MDNAIRWIIHYPLESAVCFANTYPLDSDFIRISYLGYETLCKRLFTVFLCPCPGHSAVIASSFAIQVVSSDRDLIVLVFQKTSGFVGVKLTVWNLYWKCVTWLSLWFKIHGESNIVTVPCFLGWNLREANKCHLLSKESKLKNLQHCSYKPFSFTYRKQQNASLRHLVPLQQLKSPNLQPYKRNGLGKRNTFVLSTDIAPKPGFLLSDLLLNI